MIADFIDSWPLFYPSYLAGWLMAVLLALVGVIVVARNQIFLGAAVSQTSTLGIALAMWIGSTMPRIGEHEHESHELAIGMSILFSMLAAMLAGGSRGRRESREAVTGWVFLLAASLSILVVARSPLGLEEVQRLQASSLIGATAMDVACFATLAVLAGLIIFPNRQRIILIAVDPVMADAVGLRTRAWDTGLSLLLGLAIGLSIHSGGMLFAFGCLVLPALIAKNLSREIAPLFWVSPLIALALSVASFVIANHHDFPPGQLTVALMGAALAAAWGSRAVRR